MKLSRPELGLSVTLPPGWEGRIRGFGARDLAMMAASSDEDHRPVVHLANFGLPADPGDFGGDAVHRMVDGDAFVSLIEHGPESVGTALFSDHGLPRNLRPADFHPRALQRTLQGQGGFQHFFTEAGRPFCLYVVVGSFRGAARVVGQINRALATITIGARG